MPRVFDVDGVKNTVYGLDFDLESINVVVGLFHAGHLVGSGVGYIGPGDGDPGIVQIGGPDRNGGCRGDRPGLDGNGPGPFAFG